MPRSRPETLPEAIARSDSAAENTRSRIAEQQERFKAGWEAEGRSLDEEVPESQRLQRNAAKSAPAPSVGGNKYAVMMDRRKVMQERDKEK